MSPVGTGWWINANTWEVIEVFEHLAEVRDHPDKFGMKKSEVQGRSEEDRREILTEVMRHGWIRIRDVRNRTVAEYWRESQAVLDSLGYFAKQMKFYPSQYIESHELATSAVHDYLVEDLIEQKVYARNRPKHAGKLVAGGGIMNPNLEAVYNFAISLENPLPDKAAPMFKHCGRYWKPSYADNPNEAPYTISKWGKPSFGRLIMGLRKSREEDAVKKRFPKITEDDLLEAVPPATIKEVRESVRNSRVAQVGHKGGATLYPTFGYWYTGDGELIEEPSTEIVIIPEEESWKRFAHLPSKKEGLGKLGNIFRVAGILLEEYKQKSIIFQLVRKGVIKQSGELEWVGS